MKPSLRLAVFLIVIPLALMPLSAASGRAVAVGLTAEDEERDAREIADRINEALNIRGEVIIALLNDTSVTVRGRIAARRYWLIITEPDGSEFRFRASLVASVKIR